MAKRDMGSGADLARRLVLLFLGGLLVGLGAPFWYNAVTGLTNIRNAARGTPSADAQTRAAVVAAGLARHSR